MGDLARQVGDLGRQVADLRRRMLMAEQKTAPAAEQARAAIPTFAADIDELGLIVHQLAETVAAHESTIADQYARASEQARPEAAGVPPAEPATASGEASAASVPEAAIPAAPRSPVAPMSREDMIEAVRGILDANRADLYLQPIVSLPQRRVRYYETFTRLRNEDGSLLMPGEFLAAAESGGLMPRIDHLVLPRAAQIVRRLLSKNRDIGLICNIATKTLTDPQSSQRLLQFFDANQELASALVLEFPQSFWRSNGPLPQASLSALAKLGVRFSVDHVTDLRVEPRELAERGIRLIKVPARVLLAAGGAREFDIHPADLSDLMARFGIGLIAEQIESEVTVADLLDLEVRLGQGFLFSPPRPVRADVLQGTGDETPERAAASMPREAAPARRAHTNAVEEIGRTGMLPEPAPGAGGA
jgi:cyclic-di-GMP phosphodiesterase TipF (flagellum assembly factor)